MSILPKMKVEELSIGDLVRESWWNPDTQATERLFSPVLSIEPGPTSAWVTLQHPVDGREARIRPRLSKVIVAKPADGDA